jgi:Fe-S-cluster-containing dehydrogenase component
MQYCLLFDSSKCFGCQICEVACKQENNIPRGPRLLRVIQLGPEEINGKLTLSFSLIRCRHCVKPICADVCPTKAIVKRADGIVLINPEQCIGCMACIEACPFSAPQFNPHKGVVEKCTLCAHRIDRGLKPACVEYCPSGAIIFGEINNITEQIRKRIAKKGSVHARGSGEKSV